jgi:hypothetical protein
VTGIRLCVPYILKCQSLHHESEVHGRYGRGSCVCETEMSSCRFSFSRQMVTMMRINFLIFQ